MVVVGTKKNKLAFKVITALQGLHLSLVMQDPSQQRVPAEGFLLVTILLAGLRDGNAKTFILLVLKRFSIGAGLSVAGDVYLKPLLRHDLGV